MRTVFRAVAAAALAAVAMGSRSFVDRTERLSEAVIAQVGWVQEGPATGAHSFHVAVKTEGAEALLNKVEQVSNPQSADYRNYWTTEQLQKVVYPKAGAMEAVVDWVKSEGLDFEIVGSGDLVRVSGAAARVGSALNVQLNEFSHPQRSANIVRALDAYSVPAGLEEHIDFISAINSFPVITKQSVGGAGGIVNPSVIRKLYKVTDSFSGKSDSSAAVAEFQGQTYAPKDLAQFEKQFNLPTQTVRKVIGPNAPVSQVEAGLDIQYIIVGGQKIPTDFWLEKTQAFDLLDFAAYTNTNGSALVWSVSYGEAENLVTVDYATRLDQEFQKAATLGRSIIFASGDSGVYSRSPSVFGFNPSFPASLPHVTSVGATFLNADGTETSAISFSGGGFGRSKYFKQPSYQKDAVANYFKSGVKQPPKIMYNSNGRGFPDVSALGVNYEVVINGAVMGVSGTSASAPCFAGIIAQVNDAIMSQGAKPLGFLNPFIYQNGDAFNDITKGENNNGKLFGFSAAKGWDPVTGFGTPDYTKLKAAALKA